MTTIQRRIATTARLGAALLLGTSVLAGCEESVPEVNAENCKRENILKIKNKSVRQELGSACMRWRARDSFRPTPPENDRW